VRVLDSVDELDYRDYLYPGDRLAWGQACGEPLTLVEHLLCGPLPPRLSAFVGINVADTIRVEHAARFRLISYIGSGGNSGLHAAGLLDIEPRHYSTLPDFVRGPDSGVDVALIRIPPPDAQGRISLGTNHDYIADAVLHARVVIAEIDERAPYSYGDTDLSTADIDVAVPARWPTAELTPCPPDAVQQLIAKQVADLVDDGATLQVGVGSMTDAVLSQLNDRRDLGLHSGQIPDGIVDLMLSGVLTGQRKILDRGVAVGGMLLGTQRLFDFAHRNPLISLRRAGYTHAQAVLARQPKFTAINSALEVDLTGQINSEVARGRYIGAIGGAVDFVRGAAASPGGVPIVMVPATAGPTSRVVADLSGPVSVPRSDSAVIVTEYGRADLRGLTLSQRADALIAVAAPEHRGRLSHAADAAVAAARRSQTR
jgi:acyl-CoA hydrolase